ncbi:MAG: N-acetyltransferase family protein [Bacteroidia bacterium]
MLNIRPATINDLPEITEIYNEAVLNTTATFDTEPKTLDDRKQWFAGHTDRHPIAVATIEDKIVGWASLSRWSDRCAYDTTVEVSVYVEKDYRGRGIGKQLMEVITLEGKKTGAHNIISRITSGNEKSIHIHELLGYEHVGVLKEVGKKFGDYLNVHIMQKVFK